MTDGGGFTYGCDSSFQSIENAFVLTDLGSGCLCGLLWDHSLWSSIWEFGDVCLKFELADCFSENGWVQFDLFAVGLCVVSTMCVFVLVVVVYVQNLFGMR